MTAAQKVSTRRIDYRRMPMAELQQRARQMHPEHDDEATRVYVQRLIDLELERRLDLVHRRAGWHPASPGFGDGTGASTEVVDAMFLAYIKGIPNSPWHEVARKACKALPSARLLALMIRAAKSDCRINGPFAAKYDDIAKDIGRYAQMLGFTRVQPVVAETETRIVEREVPRQHRNSRHVWPMTPEAQEAELERLEAAKAPRIEREVVIEKLPVFKNGEAIRWAARQALAELTSMAKL